VAACVACVQVVYACREYACRAAVHTACVACVQVVYACREYACRAAVRTACVPCVQVVYACREYACRATDVLARRTRLAFLNVHAAEEALPRVIEIMARELGWSAQKQKATRHSIILSISLFDAHTHTLSLSLSLRLSLLHCLHSMWSRVYAAVGRPSVRLSVRPPHAATAGLLLWARRAGDIDRCRSIAATAAGECS